MKALKKAFISVGVAIGLLAGALGFATPASAYTNDYNNVVRYYGTCQPTPNGTWMYYMEVWNWRDYDWWEETFMGQYDRYVYWYTGYYYC